MSFFTSFQELLDFDQSTNLNGFHFSNSLFGFDSNSIPALENLPPPTALADPHTLIANARLNTPSPIPEPEHMLETPKHRQTIHPVQQQSPVPVQFPTPQNNNHQHVSSIPIVSKFQLKVTPNNEIYISNESGTFCELAGSFVPSVATQKAVAAPIADFIPPASPEVIEPEPEEPEPPKTLFCIERGVKRPLSPSDHRYCNSGIFRSLEAYSSPTKKIATSTTSNGLTPGGPEQESAAKLVVSNVINNGLIVNKKHLSNNEEQNAATVPERRVMRTKKKKKKLTAKTTAEAKVEPVNGKISTGTAPGQAITSRKVPQQQIVGNRPSQVQDNLRKVPIKPLPVVAVTPTTTTVASASTSATMESTLNFSGIKEKAAQEAIFIQRVEKQPSPQQQQLQPPSQQQQQQQPQNQLQSTIVQTECVPVIEPDTKLAPEGAAIPDETCSSPAPVELKVVADLVMDKEVFGHISLLSNEQDRNKAVIYQNPVTTKNVIYSILNPKSLNLSLGGSSPDNTASQTLEPHRRIPKKRGRKKKIPGENPPNAPEANGLVSPTPIVPDLSAIDPDVPVMVTRSGRLSKPPRYANNFFQNIKQKPDAIIQLPPPPPPPLTLPRIDLPATDPETIEKLPNFSAALTSTVASPASHPEPEPKRKINIPLQYRCATCNKIYLGRRMQRHLEKYPNHNSLRDCMDKEKGKNDKEEEKSTYLYKHLFDLLQKFTEKDKGRVMLREISNFVDYVRALIPKLITNDEQNSTVEYIDHNVADVLRLNHGKYRLKLSSLAEEYDKLNLTVNLLNNSNHGMSTPNRPSPPLSTSTPNGTTERHSLSFNADDLLNQSSSFPSLTTLMHEHNLLLQQNGTGGASNNVTNNNNSLHQQNNNHQHQQSNHHHHHHPHHHSHHHHYSNHHHHLPLIGSSCHDDAMNSLSGLCKSPVQHSASGMVNMALNLY